MNHDENDSEEVVNVNGTTDDEMDIQAELTVDESELKGPYYDKSKLLTSLLDVELDIIGLFPYISSTPYLWPLLCAIHRYGVLERYPWLLRADLIGDSATFSCNLSEAINKKIELVDKKQNTDIHQIQLKSFESLYSVLLSNSEVTILNSGSDFLHTPMFCKYDTLHSYVKKVKDYFLYGLQVDIHAIPTNKVCRIMVLRLLSPCLALQAGKKIEGKILTMSLDSSSLFDLFSTITK